MLPILMYNTMESGSNSANNSFSSAVNIYEDHVAMNGLRSRKKTTDLQTCPVCSCTIRNGELESHFSLEMERLQKLSSSGTKRKLSSSGNLAVPGSSTSSGYQDDPYDEDIDLSGGTGTDVFQRVHTNRLQRLRARRRTTPPPSQGECPVCNITYPTSRLQRHALRCLKRTGAQLDEDVPDFSSEDESIDVENDEPPNTGFGAEYEWCGETRVRATALQDAEARQATCVRRASNDTALVVDDDDTDLYGPPQFSPSRIDSRDDSTQSNGDDQPEASPEHNSIVDNGLTMEKEEQRQLSEKDNNVLASKTNGLVEASAETRIQALKARIKELENKQNSGTEVKCLICLGPYTSPVVSTQCWHVHCEVCWLESLRAKKICPQCNLITTAQHLRRIYM